MFAQPAALLLLITKALRDGEPFKRLLEFAVVRSHHPSQRRGQLGAHRHFALAFIGKIKKLADNFRPAFFCVERSWLEQRPIPFYKTVTARHFAPAREDIIADGAISGKEIAKAGERLHWFYSKENWGCKAMRPELTRITKRGCG
jgi:hypothetical protein